jgi:diguanylate cyclase (GGDEF)-like protein
MLARVLRRVTTPLARTTAATCVLYVVAGAALAYFLLSVPDANHRGAALQFASISTQNEELSHREALEFLHRTDKVAAEVPTNLSERPFWILAELPNRPDEHSASILLPSRHAKRVSVWLIGSEDKVLATGSIERGGSGKFLHHTRAGFSIEVPDYLGPTRLVARVHSRGPGRISAELWQTSDLEQAARRFDQAGGVLFGSLLMIAAFGALISVLARDSTFFIFSAWTITSLRFASYSSGWDFTWLGLPELDEYPRLVRNLSLAAYALLTVALFRGLFKRDIARLGASTPIRIIALAAATMMLVGLIVPQQIFLPIMWALAIPSLAYMVVLTVIIIARTGSTAALWYCASWLATLSASFAEIAFATGIVKQMPALVNSVSGAVFSALLAAIALADRIKSERVGRVRAQAKTVLLLNRFKENYTSMPIGLFSVSHSGQLSLFNPAFEKILSPVGERNIREGLDIDSLITDGSFDRLSEAADSGDSDIEICIPGTSGGSRWLLARVTRRDGCIEGSIQDVTSKKLAEEQLRHLVDHDPLTGLLNRRGLEAALAHLFQGVGTRGTGAIAKIDLDRFRLINDLHGHATGDALLSFSAARLLATVRHDDQVARVADSFVILLPDCSEQSLSGLLERIRASISDTPFEIDGKGLTVTASVGVVTIDASMSAIDAVAAADRACSEAKSRGRNCVIRLTEHDAQLKAHLEELKVVADLQQRIPTERYFLEFQPIVALQSAHASLSYEVLIRMRGEGGQTIPPGKFIGAAERNGLMSQIDRWVLRSTLEWLDNHPKHRDRLSFATLNISGASLNDTRFVDDAFSLIADHPFAMRKLCFEITESVALHDIGSTRRFVDRVRMYGSKLALDDFGAGYTSFNYLKEIPADFIKIDGSFVKDINRNPANYAITRMIVDLTHELGMSSIAEWAETPDTIASLIELGVDYGQGFGLVRPTIPSVLAAARSGGELIVDPVVLRLLNDGALHGSAARREHPPVVQRN